MVPADWTPCELIFVLLRCAMPASWAVDVPRFLMGTHVSHPVSLSRCAFNLRRFSKRFWRRAISAQSCFSRRRMVRMVSLAMMFLHLSVLKFAAGFATVAIVNCACCCFYYGKAFHKSSATRAVHSSHVRTAPALMTTYSRTLHNRHQ